MNEIEQNIPNGEILCVPYNDDGKLRVWVARVLVGGRELLASLDCNSICGLDEGSRPILGQQSPMVSCCFNKEDDIYVHVYHRTTLRHFVFLFSYKTCEVVGTPKQLTVLASTPLNFPLRTFYSETRQEIYTFYRQGQCVQQLGGFEEPLLQEQLPTADLGQMYLIFGEAVLARSSNSVILFKKQKEDGRWA